jgi:hypothetical protein
MRMLQTIGTEEQLSHDDMLQVLVRVAYAV